MSVQMLHVGDVRFVFDADSGVCTCSLCARKMAAGEIADHARKKHRALSRDVLPGQMGLPGFGVVDVPTRG